MRLTFADSEVAGVDAQGDCLVVRFSAAAVEPSAQGEEAGYLLGLSLQLQGATWTGDLAAAFGRLREGELADASTRFTRLDLPFEGPGPRQASFDFANGASLRVTAARVRAVPDPQARFRASYAC